MCAFVWTAVCVIPVFRLFLRVMSCDCERIKAHTSLCVCHYAFTFVYECASVSVCKY